MPQPARLRRLLITLALILAGGAAGFLVLPAALPFLVGWAAALCVEKPVRALSARTRLPRWICTGLSMSAALLLAGSALFLLLRRLALELGGFAGQLPELLGALSGPAGAVQAQLYALAGRLPDGLSGALEACITSFFSGSDGLAARLTGLLLDLAGRIAAALPDLLLFLFTAVLSGYMISAGGPKLRETAQQRLPAALRQKLRAAGGHLKRAFGGWFRAQLMLMGITFLIVTAGLMLLRMDYPLLFGLLVALVDALPVFGTGTVLIPWALLMFLRAKTRCGIGLLLVYAAASLTRSALEPKLIGRQLGLPPLLTLFAMYAGYRWFGLPGMILLPIAAIFLAQLWKLAAADG